MVCKSKRNLFNGKHKNYCFSVNFKPINWCYKSWAMPPKNIWEPRNLLINHVFDKNQIRF